MKLKELVTLMRQELAAGALTDRETRLVLAEEEARAAAPVRREPPFIAQSLSSDHSLCMLTHPVVDDGPHGRRRPAIRLAAHAHVRQFSGGGSGPLMVHVAHMLRREK